MPDAFVQAADAVVADHVRFRRDLDDVLQFMCEQLRAVPDRRAGVNQDSQVSLPVGRRDEGCRRRGALTRCAHLNVDDDVAPIDLIDQISDRWDQAGRRRDLTMGPE